MLPKWAGALWTTSALLFYVLGAALGMLTTGGSLVTQPMAASLMVISGVWVALSVLRRPSSVDAVVGAQAQPRVQ